MESTFSLDPDAGIGENDDSDIFMELQFQRVVPGTPYLQTGFVFLRFWKASLILLELMSQRGMS